MNVAFTIAYLLRILHDPDSALAANLAFDAIQRAMPSLESCGFDMELVCHFLPVKDEQELKRQAKDFIDPLLELVRAFDASSTGTPPSEYSLIQSLQDPERSNSIVCVSSRSSTVSSQSAFNLMLKALRLITSAQIRTNPTQFSPFLFHPLTFEPLTADDFCRSEVEPCGKEADQVQITALSEALGTGVRIAYLDRSDLGDGSEEVINWVEFGEKVKEGDRPLTLLYRWVQSGAGAGRADGKDQDISTWSPKMFCPLMFPIYKSTRKTSLIPLSPSCSGAQFVKLYTVSKYTMHDHLPPIPPRNALINSDRPVLPLRPDRTSGSSLTPLCRGRANSDLKRE